MKHRIWMDEENKVIRMKVVGDFSKEEMQDFFNKVELLYGKDDHRRTLCDASECYASEYKGDLLDTETRVWLRNRAEEIDLGKIALLGLNPADRMRARMVAGILGKSEDTCFFRKEEEALAWLAT